MAAEARLERLLSAMRPVLAGESYVFAPLPADRRRPDGLLPLMAFREAEGETLIVTQAEAQAAGLAFTFRCRMITLTVHSALEAVGFLAAVTAALAAAGIPVNPVSAYHHDHLFVPEDRAEAAMAVLAAIGAGRPHR